MRRYIILLASFLAVVSCITTFEEPEINSSDFSASVSTLSFDYSEASTSFTLTCGSQWNIVSTPNFITVKDIKADKTPFKWIITITCQANTDSSVRNGDIVIENAAKNQCKIGVSQAKIKSPDIQFADSEVKSICVANWDTDGDKQLSEEEASQVTSLGQKFRGNSKIRSFNELKYFTKLEKLYYDFENCSSLTSVTLPSDIKTIDAGAFKGCESLKEIVIPEKVLAISGEAFRGCNSLTAIRIPANVKDVSDAVFAECPKLKTFSGSFASSDNRFLIKDGRLLAFAPAELKSCNLPSTVKSIGNATFYACGELSSVSLSSNLESIGEYSFYHCTGLASVEITSGVTSIGKNAFDGCKSFAFIECRPLTPPTGTSGMFDNTGNCPIYVPSSSLETYKGRPYWNNYSSRIFARSTGTVLSFTGNDALKSICVANWDADHDGEITTDEVKNVKTIGTLFRGKDIKSFDELQYFTGLESLDDFAFRGCKELTSITLPNSIKSVGKGVFADCPKLSSIKGKFASSDGSYLLVDKVYAAFAPAGRDSATLPSTAESLGAYTFYGCSNLKSLTLPLALKTLGEYSCYGCSKLESVDIPANVSAIETYALANCSGLKTVECRPATPPEGGYGMFSSAGSSLVIYVPAASLDAYKKKQYWSDYASRFKARYSGSEVPFDDSTVKELCVQYFDKDDDGKLTASELAEVTGIGTIFRGKGIKSFDELESFTSLESLDDFAFRGCKELASITLPNSIKSVGKGVFADCPKLSSIKGKFASSDGSYLLVDKVYAAFAPAGRDSATLPSTAESLGAYTFYSCSNLKSLTLPSTLKTLGEYSFYGCSKLESVDIPASVSSIEQYAFAGCSSLTTIECQAVNPPAGGSGMFNNTNDCPIWVPAASIDTYKTRQYWSSYKDRFKARYNGTAIEFKDKTVEDLCVNNWDLDGDGKLTKAEAEQVTELGQVFKGKAIKSFDELQYFTKLTQIPEGAFQNCSSLQSVTLPNGLKSIGKSAFELCKALTSITVPNGVTSIGDAAFIGCSKLATVSLSTGLTSLGNSVFEACSSLESIVLPTSLNTIGNGVFSECTNLRSFSGQYASDDNRLLIKNNEVIAFAPKDLSSYTLPLYIVNAIGSNAFAWCTELTELTLPESLKTIKSEAFVHCSKLEALEIPSGVMSIGSSAFSGCSSLTIVECKPVTPPSGGTDMFKDTNNCPIYVPAESLEKYEQAQYWSVYSARFKARYNGAAIEFKDKTVEDLCVNNWDLDSDGKLTKAEAEKVTDIKQVFKGKAIKSFDELQYFTKLTELPAKAFSECTSLASVKLPSGIKTIGGQAFYSCSALTSISLPYGTTSIGSSAFDNCTSLSSVSLPYTVTKIEDKAFSYCVKLPSISLPTQLTTLGDYAFESCSGLTTISLPSSLQSIGTAVFSGCTGLSYFSGKYASSTYRRLLIKDNEVIAFAPYDLISYIGFPSGVTGIGEKAFAYCSELMSLTLPEGLKTIAASAFTSCAKLQSIVIPSSVTSIGNFAFSGCTSFKSIECQAPNPPSGGLDMFLETNNCDIYVPAASLDTYKKKAYWSTYSSRLKPKYSGTVINFQDDLVKSLCVANWDLDGDEEITREEAAKVEDIGIVFKGQAITSFDELQHFTRLTKIPQNAFYNCTSLTSVIVPPGVKSIDKNAFNMCPSLTSVSLPSGLTSIGVYAFMLCGALPSVSIPSGVTSIGEGAFSYCGKIASITIPSKVESIGNYAFLSCSGLSSINIPSSVSSIGFAAFASCTSLSSFSGKYASDEGRLLIKDGTVVASAPASLSGSYSIPSTVYTIGAHAFNRCTKLQSIEIPSGVTGIGASAFYGCNSLTSLKCLAVTPPAGGSDMFKETNNCPIYVPVASVDAYKAKQYWSDYASRIQPNGTMISFKDDKVKNICVGHWDSDGDGELTTEEAGKVTDLNSYFYNSSISSFDELQYFIGLKSLNEREFYHCASLTSITLPKNLNTIGERALYWCEKLGSVNIPDSVTSIESRAFARCTSLASFSGKYASDSGRLLIKDGTVVASAPAAMKGFYSIPSTVHTVGDYAFYYDTGITSLRVPSGVKSIGNNAFRYCTGLESIEFMGVDPPAGGTDMFYNTNSNLVIYVPSVSVDKYKDAQNWYTYRDRITTKGDIISFADPDVKAICVAIWDKDGDTELSTVEAAAVTSLGEVFKGNKTIKSFEELQNFTGLTKIDKQAFNGCSSLKSILLPAGVTVIEESAFGSCSALESITLPDALQVIGKDAFHSCNKLPSVTIPSKVKSIGFAAFSQCVGLTTVNIPSSVTSIAAGAFSRCINIKSFSGKYIKDNGRLLVVNNEIVAVAHASIPANYTIPSDVVTIGQETFADCQNLTSIGFPSSLKNIGYSAFNSCSKLSSLEIPSTVTSIGGFAFCYCKGLTVINCKGTTPPTGGSDMFLLTNNCPIYVPTSAVNAYKTKEYWSAYADRIKSNAPTITFKDATVKELCVKAWDTDGDHEINKDEAAAVTSLGEVFKGNKTIKSFEELQNFTGLTKIDKQAFSGCSSLKSILLPAGVTVIEESAFGLCSALESITLPEALEVIGQYAFNICNKLPSVTIPSKVKSIGFAAFSQCVGLTTVNIPSSVTGIAAGAFSECINIKSFSGKYIKDNGRLLVDDNKQIVAVAYASIPANYTIPSDVVTIGQWTFADCQNLTSIGFPSSLKNIGYSAFHSCSKLSSLEIPSTVTSIGGLAFYNCQGLTVINCKGTTPPAGGDKMFDDTNDCPIYVPNAAAVSAYNAKPYWKAYSARIRDISTANLINFKDATVKDLCVRNWDTNGDGELSFDEAAVVTTIGDVFKGNKIITSFNELSYFTTIKRIENRAFENCEKLGSIIIPESVTAIGEKAFNGCASLPSVQLPQKLETINERAFQGCSSLTSIDIPSGVTNIKTAILAQCPKLKSITGRWASDDNRLLIYDENVTQNVKTLVAFAPADLTSYDDMPYYVTKIGTDAIRGCSNLVSMRLSPSIVEIADYAFRDCGRLNSMIIPAKVKTMGPGVFWGCSNLSYLYCYPATPPALGDKNLLTGASNCYIGVPSGSLSKYKGATNWSTYSSKMFAMNEESYISFADSETKKYCLQNWDSNGDDELSYAEAKAVTKLGDAFKGKAITSFNELKHFTGLQRIDEHAFYYCSSLKEISIPSNVSSIGKDAFRNCNSLATIILPDNLQSIEEGTFAGCVALKGVSSGGNKLPDSVKTIGNYAFDGCTALYSPTLPNALESIGESAFRNCSGSYFSSLVIPENVKRIGKNAFNGCIKLSNINVKATTPPEGGDKMFDNTNNCPIYVPSASLNSYKTANYWSNYYSSGRIKTK